MAQPEELVRVAVVGTNFGAWWARCFARHPEVRVEAICGLDADKAGRLAEELGAERVYGSYDRVLDDDEVDAVMLATPGTMHAPQAVQGLEAGKHVLSCMPAAITVEQCRDLLGAVSDTDRVYMLAEPSCYYPTCGGCAAWPARGSLARSTTRRPSISTVAESIC